MNLIVISYYYSDYYATDGMYDLYFRIVFKVGNPQIATPLEHIQYNYNNSWRDQISSIDYKVNDVLSHTKTYAYDESGNIKEIDDSRDSVSSENMTWEGRQLKSLIKDCYSISYKYNDQGIRTEKQVSCGSDTTVTKYIVNGDKVLVEYRGTNIIYYTYDADGSLLSMNLNGNEYFYVTNLQGDIIEIVDINLNTVVSYKYDAWGNIIYQTNNDLARINPYRYRGYRYDEETGWYYLNSRYYNPEIGRYINANDVSVISPSSINGVNLYTYSVNNPVMVSNKTERVAQVYGTSAASSIVSNGGFVVNNLKATNSYKDVSNKQNLGYLAFKEFNSNYYGNIFANMGFKAGKGYMQSLLFWFADETDDTLGKGLWKGMGYVFIGCLAIVEIGSSMQYYNSLNIPQKDKNLAIGLEIGNVVTTTSFVIAGAAIGQALIPIPVVGAVVGGIVGGLVGNLIYDESVDWWFKK